MHGSSCDTPRLCIDTQTGLAEPMFAFPGFLQLLCEAEIFVYYTAYETLNGP